MKNLFIILLLIVGLCSYSQNTPPSSTYTPFVSGQWNRGFFKSLHIMPSGATPPAFLPGEWPWTGKLNIDSVNHVFKFYSGGAWRTLASGGAGTMLSVSGLSPLFTVTNPTTSAVFNLSNVGSYHLFGRALGTGPPSYLSSIDSNWIPTLHTQEYYDARYTTMFGGSSNLIFNSPLEKFGNDVFVDYISPTWNAAWIQSHPVQAIQPLQGQTLMYDSATGILKWQYPDSIAMEIANNKVDSVTFIPGINTDSVFYWVEDTATLAGIIDQKCGLITPGTVVYDSLLSFTISPSIHKSCCDGIRYTTAIEHITLSAAHATLDRYDVIALEGDQVVVVEGTPSATPAKPQLSDCQTELTFIYIPAASTVPGGETVIDTVIIYDQNVEWLVTGSFVTFDADNTVSPHHLTKAVSVGAITSTSNLKFTSNVTEYQKQNYNSLRFFIKLKSTFANTCKIQLVWFNNGVAVSSIVTLQHGAYGFDRTNSTTYQEIIIPMSDWGFGGNNTFDALWFQSTGANINGFYVDWIMLTGGIPQQQITHPNSFGVVTTQSGTATSTQPNDVLNIVGAGGITTSATGKTVTINGSGAGVTTMGTFGSSPNAEGGTISGNTLTLQPASGTFPGGVTTGTQTIAGDKNLAGNTTLTKYAVGWQFVVTSAGTETLTATSLYATSFTGTTTHTLVLPDATTLKLGQLYRVRNNSTGSITINKNGGSNLLTLLAGYAVNIICTDISGAAGTWEYEISSSTVASGSKFGKSGEDATGAEIRKFNSSDFSFQIDSAADYTFYSNTVSNRQGQYDLAPDFFQLQIKRNDLANTYAGYYGTINGSAVPSLEFFSRRASVDRVNSVVTTANEITFKSEQMSAAIRRDYDFRIKHLPGKSSLGAGDSLTVVDNTNGQLWKIAATDLGITGGTSALSKARSIQFPSAIENTTLWKTPVDITITDVYAVSTGTSPSVTFQIVFGSDRTSGTNVYTSGRTTTSTTTGDTFNSSFNDATIPAGSWIWITTSAQSGTVTELTIQVNYTED